MERYKAKLDLQERFEICLQHWTNSMDAVMEDRGAVNRFTVVAFEDFLESPRRALDELCSFLELQFDEAMVPAEGQRLPFGTRFGTRWFPLRTDVNEPYLDAIPDDLLADVVERAGSRAAEFGYRQPGTS